MSEQPTPDASVQALRPPSLPAKREQPIEKAGRLITAQRVQLLPSARVYEVQGDTSTYRVIATFDGIFCPCRARTALCAHVLAVALTRQKEQFLAGVVS